MSQTFSGSKIEVIFALIVALINQLTVQIAIMIATTAIMWIILNSTELATFKILCGLKTVCLLLPCRIALHHETIKVAMKLLGLLISINFYLIVVICQITVDCRNMSSVVAQVAWVHVWLMHWDVGAAWSTVGSG